MNEAIMNLISDNQYIAMRTYDGLREQWPQINERTQIRYTPNRMVYYAQTNTYTPLLPPAPEPDNLNRWWRGLFTRRNLDNPLNRWQYQQTVFRQLRRLPLVLWKTVSGQARREEIAYRQSMVAQPIQREEIRLQRFAWQMATWGHNDEYGHLYCGYHAATDTLWVYRK